jgi:hypothetical protein
VIIVTRQSIEEKYHSVILFSYCNKQEYALNLQTPSH